MTETKQTVLETIMVFPTFVQMKRDGSICVKTGRVSTTVTVLHMDVSISYFLPDSSFSTKLYTLPIWTTD